MKKLTPSKMLSSMALATLLVAAAGTQTAQAAGFDYTAPNGNQAAGVQDTSATGNGNKAQAEGDIVINGFFNKTVTNLPAPKQEGSFLIVTMPLNLSYTYDADTGYLTGSQGVIENQSVKVENKSGTLNYTAQPVKMKVVSLTEGTYSTDAQVKFIETYDSSNTTDIQVPLQVSLKGSSMAKADVYSFASIQKNQQLANQIDIEPNTNVNVSIEEIPGQKVQNTHLIQKNAAVAKHNLKFQFEYAGQ